MTWSVELRAATQADINRCEQPSQVHVNDGAAAVLVNGELVAVTNEYGTALLVAGTEVTPTADDVEIFVGHAMAFYDFATRR